MAISLVAWVALLIFAMFDGPFQPNPEKQNSGFHFVAPDSIEITESHQLRDSEQCKQYRKQINAIINSTQSCHSDADCFPLIKKGKAINLQNRQQLLDLKANEPTCPTLIQVTLYTPPMSPYSNQHVACLKNICQKTIDFNTQKAVFDTVNKIKFQN